jgi:hypothetical protein
VSFYIRQLLSSDSEARKDAHRHLTTALYEMYMYGTVQGGMVYNELSRDDKRELLRQMLERVIVDSTGDVRLELRTPVSYLQDITDQVRSCGGESAYTPENTKNQHYSWFMFE